MDQYTKATKCLIAFNGWKNFYDLKKINNLYRDKITITEKFCNTDKEMVKLGMIEKREIDNAEVATEEDLALIRKLPLVQRGMQTDTDEFNAYLVGLGANFGRKMSRQGTEKKLDEGFKTAGTTCRMLDSEQVNFFIFDSLCNDKYLQKVIEEKRKYENMTNYDAITTLDNENTYD